MALCEVNPFLTDLVILLLVASTGVSASHRDTQRSGLTKNGEALRMG